MQQQVDINYQEDEIDLRELFKTLLNNKWKIIFFTIIVTTCSIFYSLTIPNSYKSETVLVPQGQSKGASLGGLSALAGLAGVDISGGGDVNAFDSLSAIIADFEFNKELIIKYNLIEKLANDENFIFAMNDSSYYQMLKSKTSSEVKDVSLDEKLFLSYQKLKSIVSMSQDKKSSTILLIAETNDRFLAKELVEIYLIEATAKLREIEMSDVNSQIKFYQDELSKANDVALKEQLSKLTSTLMQKRVLSQANRYYVVKQLTLPQVAYIKDKTKPKRALIVVVSFVTSLILAIFGVFLLEFMKSSKEEKYE